MNKVTNILEPLEQLRRRFEGDRQHYFALIEVDPDSVELLDNNDWHNLDEKDDSFIRGYHLTNIDFDLGKGVILKGKDDLYILFFTNESYNHLKLSTFDILDDFSDLSDLSTMECVIIAKRKKGLVQ